MDNLSTHRDEVSLALCDQRELFNQNGRLLPKKKIPDFGALLVREEGPGLLNWFVAGADMILRDIDQSPDGDIVLTERQKGIVDSLLAESDSLRFFLRDRVERAEDADLLRVKSRV